MIPAVHLNESADPESKAFQRTWSYVSETSAILYWQLEDISLSANSFIEYGKMLKSRKN